MTKIILHAHVFYPELWPELLSCIENCRAEVGDDSLFVVATCPETKPELRETLERSLRAMRHEVIAVPNRGYDVGPFVEYVLNRPDFASFDFVVKLHTKRDVDLFFLFRMFRGAAWRRELLSFCSTREAFRRSLAAFEQMPRLGMIAGSRVISRGGLDYSRAAIREVRSLGRKFGVERTRSGAATAVFGTMFMARTKCLLPLAGLSRLSDFELVTPANVHQGGSLAHAYEGTFAFAVSEQGYLVSDGKRPYSLACLAARVMFFVGRSWRFISSFGRL